MDPTDPTVSEMVHMALYETDKAHWDDGMFNTFVEELMHLQAELAEVFEAWRLYKDFDIHYDEGGVPQGVPIELADILIGIMYNAGLHEIDIAGALLVKHTFNCTRDYREEGRQLHPQK